MKFILGTKEYMTQIFDDNGVAHPATLVSAGPLTITDIKTEERDGYQAVQVGYKEAKKKNVSKAVMGHLKNLGPFKYLREFSPDQNTILGFKVGDVISLASFVPGDLVEVSGISKGKGFQGVVKRHGFAGGPRTHGQKHSEREGGSIGGGGRAGGRVVKGMKMAGRMGGDRITVRNLKVLKVFPETNELFLSGAIPGRRGTLIEVRAK